MKKLYVFLIVAFIGFISNAQTINFPDAKFKAKLLTSSASNYVASNGTQSIKIDSNNNGEIEVSEAQQVVYLNLSNSMNTLDSVKFIDITGIEYFTNMVNFSCEYNKVATLNLSNFPSLNSIYFGNNLITTIALTNLPQFHIVDCDNNLLTTVDLTSVPSLDIVSFDNNLLTSINCSALVNATELWLNYNQLTSLNISGLTSLERVFVSNNLLSTFIFNGANNLTDIGCNYNQLTQLDFTALTHLNDLTCGFNQLTSLELDGLDLQYLECSANQLTSLDISSSTNLGYLSCIQNQLTSLNLSGLNSLTILECQYNQIQTLDLTGKHLLNDLDCRNNQLTTLDIRDAWVLNQFGCGYNNLETLFIKNGVNQYSIGFDHNPNLRFICADEAEIADIQYLINANGYATTCLVNSYCTFTPGGKYYTIEGNEKLDADNNGCDVLDAPFPNLKFSVSGNSSTNEIIANETGDFSIPVGDGTYTITPIIENPTYFTISPTSTVVNFPAQTTPVIANYCVIPNGLHQDVEIAIFPLNAARPGFDANYKLVYKNKGNIMVSGTVVLAYEDAVIDLVSANPSATSQNTNNLSWNYVNLLPFESREILVTFNLNSPMETPPIVNGYQLNYTTTINPITGDEIPYDNVVSLKQIVVGSLDPNDKRCIEGTTISPSMVGQYVHYIIRFENTGTYAAENIVVKDVIDTSKFDIASLVPVDGSHSFVTRISTTNKVEFIFENINLPFDDTHNDGYVAFKIKTKPTLVAGNTFSNSANIYFDYNFPILTNTASTTIQVLSNSDFEFRSVFKLSPVPTRNMLTITTNQTVVISSMSIYNTLGQLVQVITSPSDTIDVSRLKSGSYFIKIISDKGSATGKFIKE